MVNALGLLALLLGAICVCGGLRLAGPLCWEALRDWVLQPGPPELPTLKAWRDRQRWK